ncbi:MAG: M56 family metallopeptidase [Acidimicrobiales bacterium]
MSLTLWLPLGVAVLAGLSAARLQRCLPPHVSTLVLTVTAIASALAVAWGLAIVAFGFVVQVPTVADWAGWCHLALPGDDRVPTPVGMLSLVALAVAATRAWRWDHRVARLTSALSGYAGPVEILSMSEPTAFAVPGRPGHIVVSRALLDCLDDTDQAVLFAHERAHLDLRHHRYVHLADLAAAAVPILKPIAEQVRYATERWADEVAVRAVGDRSTVAHAIARAALAVTSAPPPLALGIDGQVVARVEALLEPRRTTAWFTAGSAAALATAVVLVLASSTVQLHHFVAYAAHVCRL